LQWLECGWLLFDLGFILEARSSPDRVRRPGLWRELRCGDGEVSSVRAQAGDGVGACGGSIFAKKKVEGRAGASVHVEEFLASS
jgi:hypothetical protein